MFFVKLADHDKARDFDQQYRDMIAPYMPVYMTVTEDNVHPCLT